MTQKRDASDGDLRIEGLELRRGTKERTHIRTLELPDGSWVEVPLVVVRGARPGPVFYMGAAIHGDEINGVEILSTVASGVDVGDLQGTLLVVPVQNPLAFRIQHRYYLGHMIKSPMDQGAADPWSSFPGDPDGNMAGLIAHTLFQRLMEPADYVMDVHTPTTGGRYAPFAFLPPPRCGTVVQESERLAKAFGVDYILAADSGMYVYGTSPHVVAAERGKVALGIELGEGGQLDPEEVQWGVRGVTNVLREVGMLPGDAEPQGRRMVITAMREARARRGGLLHPRVRLNQEVAEGEVLATITNVFGDVVEEVHAPLAGPIVRTVTFPIVSMGERVAQIGVPR